MEPLGSGCHVVQYGGFRVMPLCRPFTWMLDLNLGSRTFAFSHPWLAPTSYIFKVSKLRLEIK